ncbi:hypothetical protein CEXT_711111 [Caerostris extrusa]|uniref:Uncharacterized protein n=1 Tax=Caerostris extrusa TaxID=172846 RepID=A0AAV4R484_CAEEX|nr:hypothetical protein CEXT_711111 [Caerostris extrusa]
MLPYLQDMQGGWDTMDAENTPPKQISRRTASDRPQYKLSLPVPGVVFLFPHTENSGTLWRGRWRTLRKFPGKFRTARMCLEKCAT